VIKPTPVSAVALTLCALLIAAIPHLMAMPAWLVLVFILFLAWRLGAAGFEWKPPPGVVRILITVLILFMVLVASGANWSRRAATTLLCLMMAAKLMESFSARDLRLVASICFFMMAAQFLFNERLVYLLYLALGTLSATAALAHIQQIGIKTLQPAGASQDGLVAITRNAGVMLLLALPVAITLFVLFPRLAQPLWGLPEGAIDGQTGLSDELTAGSIADLFLNDSPAFRVEFEGEPPAPEIRYWRALVLSNLDGNTWKRSSDADHEGAFNIEPGSEIWQYRVQLEPHERRWLFALDYPIRGPADSSITTGREMLTRHPVTTLTQYDATSAPFLIESARLSDRDRYTNLALPSDRNPRTRALGAQLRDQHPNPQDLVTAVLHWFGEEEFFYSLSASPLGRHGADEFLFDLRTGYCEYYASAFAILMRAAGIPTRVVLGYQGGYWQVAGNYLLVRQSDAHAWNEVWLEGPGWVRVDPTSAVAPFRIEQGARSVIEQPRHALDYEWLRQLRNRADRFQHAWNRWILGFDAARQKRLLERLGLPDAQPVTLAIIMVAVLGLIVAVLALAMWHRGRQRPTSEAQRQWQRVIARLGRRGLRKLPAETPIEFSRRIQPELGGDDQELVRLAELFSRVHYGPDDNDLSNQFIARARNFRPVRTH
jgi:protein-glutamine gamma-glutamyltransferase